MAQGSGKTTAPIIEKDSCIFEANTNLNSDPFLCCISYL
jgi:hypothetical protein